MRGSRVIILMYSLNHQYCACTRPQIYFISVNIYSYIYYSSSTSSITSGIFMQIYSFITVYENTFSTSIVWESQFFIYHISSMPRSVTSVTTGEQFLVNFSPGIWVYPCTTRRALNRPYTFFSNIFLCQLGVYLEAYLFFCIFSITPCLSCT